MTKKKTSDSPALSDTQRLYQDLVETSQDLIWQCDTEGKYTYLNPAWEATFGYKSKEMLGRKSSEFQSPETAKRDTEEFARIMQGGMVKGYETIYIGKSGKSIHLVFNAKYVHDKNGVIIGTCGTAHDISERKQAEMALRESEERFRTLAIHAPVGIYLTDHNGNCLYTNPCWCRMAGLTLEEALGNGWIKGVHPDDQIAVFSGWQQMVESEGQWGLEYRFLNRAGKVTTVYGLANPQRDESGKIIRYIGINLDITDRKVAEEAVRQSEERFSSFMEHLPACAYIKDSQGRHIFVNAMLASLTKEMGVSLVGKTNEDLWPEEIARKLSEADATVINSGMPLVIKEDVLLNGETRTFLSTKFLIAKESEKMCLAGISFDITELRRMEEKRLELERQVQHAQKVNSLGVLAGGIAHDFNNLLTGILGYSDLVYLTLPADSSTHGYIEKVINGARQAAALTQQMLAYSGKGQFVVEVLDVSSVVEDMSRLLEVSISKKCALKYRFLDGLPSIEADAAQIRQVIMNLIINASEAIGDRSGLIAVSTGVMYCDNAYLSEIYPYENLPEGQYVYLEVSDNGCGMSEETRAMVFDPFFTTKFAGHGLGLSALLGIVRSHRGAVKFYSELGRGTTFKVLFPASNKPATSREVPEVKPPHWRSSGIALIVDDEESVRGLARVMMEEMGFTVLTASNGREGVEVFRREAERISVVLLDMTMPHMDGEEVFREMRRIRKDVPTILSSGYNEKSATVRFAGKGLAGFIQKPYGYTELLAIVSKVLEKS